jgi:hypothetical protein
MKDQNPDTPPIALELRRILQEDQKKLRSYNRLAEAIHSASRSPRDPNERDEKAKIDRRKLAAIVTGEREAYLSLHELQALDTYLLQTRGKGLGTLFHQRTVLQSLAEGRQVTFLLGSQPSFRANGSKQSSFGANRFGQWDVRSLAAFLRGIQRVSEVVHFDLEEVLLRTGSDLDDAGRRRMRRETWHRLLSTPGGPSLVSLGSSRSCLATEYMLAEMFNKSSFVRCQDGLSPDDPPFLFIWSPAEYQRVPSSFARSMVSVPGFVRKKEVVGGWPAVGMVIEGKPYQALRGHKEWLEWGLVATQRRGAIVWLVVAGLTGPATLAASNAVVELLHDGMPEVKTGENNSSVLWTIVEARVGKAARAGGDDRKLIDYNLLFKPKRWPPD